MDLDQKRLDIGSLIKKVSHKTKKKCKRQWGWSCRKIKTWFIYYNNIVILLQKENLFQTCIFLADLPNLMSNFHDFDEDQISWKFAQRYLFVLVFHNKNSFLSRQSQWFWNALGWPLISQSFATISMVPKAEKFSSRAVCLCIGFPSPLIRSLLGEWRESHSNCLLLVSPFDSGWLGAIKRNHAVAPICALKESSRGKINPSEMFQLNLPKHICGNIRWHLPT